MKNPKTLQILQNTMLVMLLSVATCAFGQTVNLQLQGDYTNDGAAYSPSLAIGDVNNDGRPDLVATNRPPAGGDFIAVYLNNGAGGFNTTPLPAGNSLGARVVALGDFNKDGNLDMAIGRDAIATGLNIRLGNGTGNFPTGTDIGSTTTVESVSDMATADFNGDGNLDLAITKVSGYNTAPNNAVKILFGNGLGGFSGLTPFALQFGGGQDIEVSDFNVDGRPDIAASAPSSNAVQVLLNNGTGGFNAPVNTTSNGARKIVSADFNRDCIPDLAVTRSGTNIVSVFLGNGTGGLGTPVLIAVTSPLTDGITAGDFNRDKKVDVAFRSTNGFFEIYPGTGAGSFGASFNLTLPNSQSAAASLAVTDANLDGKSDIVINRDGGFALYHGNSNLFTRTENDFDGDLKTDLGVFRPSTRTWFVNGSTQGSSATQWGLTSDKLTPADFDGDGKTDIAVWRENGFGDPDRSYFFIFQSSDGTARLEQFGRINDVPTMVGDWDGDGKADPAVYRSGTGTGGQSFFYYRPSTSPGTSFRIIPWGITGDQPIRGDFDGDGKADAAIFRPSNTVWYGLRSSNGQLFAQNWGLASDRPVPADYDGDAKTDLAVFRPSNNVWYILNSSNGAASYNQWGNGDSLTPGDYNGDGRTDVAVYRPAEQRWYTPQCADFKLYGQKFGAGGDVAIPSAFVP